MAKKKSRTPAEKTKQQQRTFRNQRKRYEKLIEKFPENPDVKIWKKLVEDFSK